MTNWSFNKNEKSRLLYKLIAHYCPITCTGGFSRLSIENSKAPREEHIMRCAVYIRVSTDKDEQQAFLVNQQDLAMRYISHKRWDFLKSYIGAKSGTTEKHEQLQ